MKTSIYTGWFSATSARAIVIRQAAVLSILAFCPLLTSGRKAGPGKGFQVELPNSEQDVLTAVKTVVDDHIIRGTYVYEREKVLNEASSETSSSYFGAWKGEGYVFYKVRRDALSPRNFKDSSDIGVITVRYIVHGTSPSATHLEIIAVFVEDGTNRIHSSNTTVETTEYGEIQKQLLAIQKDREIAAETREKTVREKEEVAAAADAAANAAKRETEDSSRQQVADSSIQSLEQRADELQHEIEVRIPQPNTELKAAPFRSSATLAKLPANTDVLVEVLTTYWYGVETPDGHRGWVRRDQVVALP